MSNQINYITSIKDPVVTQSRTLTTAKGRLATRKCLLEGSEHIEWALATHTPIEYVIFDTKESANPLIKKLLAHNIHCYATSEGILKKITETSYLVPFIGVAQLLPGTLLDSTQEPFIVVLDHLKDHGNIGTIIRSAHAFNIKNIILTEQKADFSDEEKKSLNDFLIRIQHNCQKIVQQQ